MFAHQSNKILRCVTLERRFAKMRILREIALRPSVQVGEIAAPAAGNANFLGDFGCMIDQPYPAPALAGLDCAHQPGGTGTNNDYIKRMWHAD